MRSKDSGAIVMGEFIGFIKVFVVAICDEIVDTRVLGLEFMFSLFLEQMTEAKLASGKHKLLK